MDAGAWLRRVTPVLLPSSAAPRPGPSRGRGFPEFVIPGFRDMRGYRAMYRDFVESIESGSQPEMSLEVAEADHRIMEQVYRTALQRDQTEID